MALGLLLLSRLDAGTDRLAASLFMLVLGMGLGLVMQVLVIAVQNTVEVRDLGAATSSATFFRSIGGSFGVAIFGAIFNARLADNLRDAFGENAPATSFGGGPEQLDSLPPAVREQFVAVFADSLQPVFLTGVPIALAAFALAWLLREIPLRAQPGRVAGVNETFGMAQVGAAAVRQEAEVRIAAARAALARLDVAARARKLPVERVAGVRDLFEARIAHLTERVDASRAASEAQPDAFWSAVVELLATERRELGRLELATRLDRDVSDRIKRDAAAEAHDLSGIA